MLSCTERFQFEYPTKILDFSFIWSLNGLASRLVEKARKVFGLNKGSLMGQFPPANLKLIQRLVAESVK